MFALTLLACTAAFAAATPAVPAAERGLEAAIRAALMQHPAVAGKTAEVQAKAAAGDAARAQRYPSLSGQIGSQDNGSRPATWRARQPLWAFGRIDRQISQADADLRVERADLQRVRRQLIEQTAVAYTHLQGLQERRQVTLDNIARHEELFGQIERRERGQLASQADTRLASSRLGQARAQLQRLDGELQVALSDLQALTQAEVAADDPVSAALLPQGTDAELEALALARSVELDWRTRQVELARADAERERVSSLPAVYLQIERNTGTPGLRSDNRVAVVIEGNVEGLGLAARGRSGAADARLRAAAESLSATRLEVLRGVRGLLSNRRTQAQLEAVQQQTVGELEQILASYRRQYEAGRKAWLDVLNMQRELTEQRLQQVQAHSDALVFGLRLAALTGSFDALAGGMEN